MTHNKTNQRHPCQGRTPTRWLFLYFSQQAGKKMEIVGVTFGMMGFIFALAALNETRSLKEKLEENGVLTKEQ